MAQRPRRAQPSVLDVPDVPVLLVQYTSSPSNVVSFLQALPLALRSPALTGLLDLLTKYHDATSDASYWPTPCLDNDIRQDRLTCMVAAISIFNSICIGDLSLSKRWSASADPTFRLPFCGFVATWAAKVTATDIYYTTQTPEHHDELSRVLSRCTNLKDVRIPGQLDLLEAVTSPAHCVSDLHLTWYAFHETTPSVVAPLQRWLASGHARYLSLDGFDTRPLDTALARALASSPTLSSLRLFASDSVVSSLVAHGATLASLTKLDAFVHSGELTPSLLSLLPLPTMKTLSVSAYATDLSNCLLEMLPHMSSLESLSLGHLELCSTTAIRPSFAAPSTLRTLTLANIEVLETNLNALFLWATNSTHLESVTFESCAWIGSRMPCVIGTVQRCIGAGVRCMRFQDCEMDTRHVSALAEALHGTQARVAFELDLSENPFLIAGAQALLNALATCMNVSIKLPRPLLSSLQDNGLPCIASARAAGVTIDVRGRDVSIGSRTTATAWFGA
ncbi:hypothetical protein SDRG_12279 [Saprolegnia diclina VS20]|uniref:F-box domain-containing protein n=1 Tax=Saprolegnia diclina (strain VS20) TaxID=1156394 RepID=T0PWX8_SAPDV|nr:hypothetical protein SDRG_12279 [Saprolegnia diclina VS20]EQC29999.1 hypothetical protein SDRG_12279 [Saprolegnia diclina VS20]|eukprot:XP_008616566.1 hypothetical protein SDRG_12279 [Saprolegnia diclina VS20]